MYQISQTDVSIHGQFTMILKVCAYGITTYSPSFFIIIMYFCLHKLTKIRTILYTKLQ